MPHHTDLLALVAVGFGLAFLLGMLAQRLRLPPLVGYLVAGISAGPFTPGFVGDPEIASQLAEIGVILLMFGVGMHVSIKELLAVRRISLRVRSSRSPRRRPWGRAWRTSGAGHRPRVSSSASHCRSPAPWSCSGRSNHGT